MNDELRISACNSNRPLAAEICDHLGLQLSPLEIARFSNDNLRVQVRASIDVEQLTTQWRRYVSANSS